MVAKYPEREQQFEKPDAEAAYNLVLGCSKAVPSLMAESARAKGVEDNIHLHPRLRRSATQYRVRGEVVDPFSVAT